jgi:hypothetical protein
VISVHVIMGDVDDEAHPFRTHLLLLIRFRKYDVNVYDIGRKNPTS